MGTVNNYIRTIWEHSIISLNHMGNSIISLKGMGTFNN